MVEKVRIRGTDLLVNPIGLGTNAVGGQKYYPNITDNDGRQFLRTAIEYGVDFWDTAFTYGPKRSEEIIGEVLESSGQRNKIVLATKAAHQFIGNKTTFNNSPQFLIQSVEESLKRLHTDYIDLFYIHFPDEETPKYEAVGALKQLKDEGKIRAIGVSNFSLEQLKEANQDGYVNVYQGKYNLLNRSAEQELFPYTIENNISFIPYFPLAAGLLAGKYTEDTQFPEGDLRANKSEFKRDQFKTNLQKVEKLKEIADDKNADVAHIVLATYLKNKAIDVVIPGAKRPEQVINNLETLSVKLTENDIKRIDNIFPQKSV